jgi:hypothetical protein
MKILLLSSSELSNFRTTHALKVCQKRSSLPNPRLFLLSASTPLGANTQKPNLKNRQAKLLIRISPAPMLLDLATIQNVEILYLSSVEDRSVDLVYLLKKPIAPV